MPEVDNIADYTVEVAGLGRKTVNLKLDQLKTKYPQYTVTAALQCSGNRRSEMNKVYIALSFMLLFFFLFFKCAPFTLGEFCQRTGMDTGRHG